MQIITKKQIEMLSLTTSKEKDEMRTYPKTIKIEKDKYIASDSKNLLISKVTDKYNIKNYPTIEDNRARNFSGNELIGVKTLEKLSKNMQKTKHNGVISNTGVLIKKDNDMIMAATTDLTSHIKIETKNINADYPNISSFENIEKLQTPVLQGKFDVKTLEKMINIIKKAKVKTVEINFFTNLDIMQTKIDDENTLFTNFLKI